MKLITSNEYNRMVCLIKTDTSQGTGTIINIDNNFSCILTCYHVIVENKNVSNNIIIKQKQDDKVIEISIDNKDLFFDETNDTAILIINHKNYPNFIIPPKVLSLKINKELQAELSGYPEVKNRNDKFRCVRLDRGRFLINEFRTEVKLETHYSDAKDNCVGFSGGAIYTNFNDNLYLLAITTEYSEITNYFSSIGIEKYNLLLTDKGFSKINIYNEDVVHAYPFQNKSIKRINLLNSTIGTDIEIDRNKIITEIENSSQKVKIIYGEPGIGKSVIIKKIAEKLKGNYFCIFSEDMNDEFNNLLQSILALSEYGQEIFILIDSAEKIFELEYTEKLIELLDNFKNKDNIKILITVRAYSLDIIERTINNKAEYQNKFSSHKVYELINEEVIEILKNKFKSNNFSKSVIGLLRNPFYLNIITERLLNKELENINNEFQLKDIIWESITEKRNDVKKILLKLVEQKLNYKLEFVDLDIPSNIESMLIKLQVIIEHELHYKFSHDKYEDIASKKFFDNQYVNKPLVEILTSINNPLKWSRAFKLWINDRLTDNDLDLISTEIIELHNSSTLYIWKWCVMETIYSNKNYLYIYLKNNYKTIDNSKFWKNMLIVTASASSMVDLKKEENTNDCNYYFNFMSFVRPSVNIYTILKFYYDNQELITKYNINFIIEILTLSCKVTEFTIELLIKYEYNWLGEIVFLLIDNFSNEDYIKEDVVYKLCLSFIQYAPLTIEKTNIFFDTMCTCIKNDFYLEFSKKLIITSTNSDKKLKFNHIFLETFYDKLLHLFDVTTQCRTIIRHHSSFSKHNQEHLYGISEDLYIEECHSDKTILTILLDRNFDKGFKFIVSYINNKFDILNKNHKIETYNFVFRDKTRKIYNIINNYASIYNFEVATPKIICCLAMGLFSKIVQLSKTTDISQYLNILLEESNNWTLISIAVNCTLISIKDYLGIFSEFAENHTIRELEINSSMVFLTFKKSYYLDDFTKTIDENYLKLFENKFCYDDAFILAQQYEISKNKMFKILSGMSSSNNINKKNFAHKIDIRNLVEISRDETSIRFQVKDSDDSQLLQFEKSNVSESLLNNEYFTLCNSITKNNNEISVNQIFELIKNYHAGKYKHIEIKFYENINIYIVLYLIKNKDILTNEQYVDVQKNLIRLCEKFSETIADDSILIHFLNAINLMEENFILKNQTIFVEFSFKIILKHEHFNIVEYDSLFINYKNINLILNKLFQLLIAYSYFDDNKFSIKKMLNEKYSPNIITQNNKIILIKSNIQYINKYIVAICNNNNAIVVEEHLFNVMKFIYNNKDNKDMELILNRLNNPISYFIVKSINVNFEIKNLKIYLFEKHTFFKEIIRQALYYLNSFVHDGDISSDIAWDFFNDVYKLIFDYFNSFNLSDYNKSDLSKFICKIFSLDCYSKCENRLLENYSDEYFEWLIKFIEVDGVLRCFARMIYICSKQPLDYYIFKYNKELLKIFSNTSNLDDTIIQYFEQIFNKIFSQYTELKQTEQNIFYELLTCFGYNAPSAFSIYLTTKIEY